MDALYRLVGKTPKEKENKEMFFMRKKTFDEKKKILQCKMQQTILG